jgi:hypothetical protein
MKNRFDARSNIDHISGPLLLAQYIYQDSKLLAPLHRTGWNWFVGNLGNIMHRTLDSCLDQPQNNQMYQS